jgi:hypothetical protein
MNEYNYHVNYFFDTVEAIRGQAVHQDRIHELLQFDKKRLVLVRSGDKPSGCTHASSCCQQRFSIVVLDVSLDKTFILFDQVSHNFNSVRSHIIGENLHKSFKRSYELFRVNLVSQVHEILDYFSKSRA